MSAYLDVEPHVVWGMRGVFVWCGVGPVRARGDSTSRSDSPNKERQTGLEFDKEYFENHKDFSSGGKLKVIQGQCMCPQGIPAAPHRLPGDFEAPALAAVYNLG
jgi:hypothetical protein